MNIFKAITSALLLTALMGCADTPENRQMWQGLAAGAQSAGQNMNNQAAELRRSAQQQAQQPYQNQNNRPTNCVTRYEPMFKEYVTQCN
jgi:hypothetical protein